MIIFKKIIFSLFFLGLLALSLTLFKPFLNSYGSIFNFSLEQFISLVIFVAALIFTSLFFVIFVTFSQDWRYVAPVALLSGVIIFLLIPNLFGVIMVTGTLLSLTFVFATLHSKLKTYITFSPTTLLAPSIKTLTFLLIATLSVAYYLSINQKINQEGFKVPDELLDQAVNLMQSPSLNPNVKGAKYIAQITPEQLELLRQNPEVLKQYGVNESMLDAAEEQIKSQPQSTTSPAKNSFSSTPSKPEATALNPLDNSFVKNMIKSQIENMIKPYQSYIAPLLAMLFFVSLTSISSILSILLNPILFVIFSILEKSGFTKFETEMREVKKLVV